MAKASREVNHHKACYSVGMLAFRHYTYIFRMAEEPKGLCLLHKYRITFCDVCQRLLLNVSFQMFLYTAWDIWRAVSMVTLSQEFFWQLYNLHDSEFSELQQNRPSLQWGSDGQWTACIICSGAHAYFNITVNFTKHFLNICHWFGELLHDCWNRSPILKEKPWSRVTESVQLKECKLNSWLLTPDLIHFRLYYSTHMGVGLFGSSLLIVHLTVAK
jgi:hypothetical protein